MAKLVRPITIFYVLYIQSKDKNTFVHHVAKCAPTHSSFSNLQANRWCYMIKQKANSYILFR